MQVKQSVYYKSYKVRLYLKKKTEVTLKMLVY